jgi:hypothetical protein
VGGGAGPNSGESVRLMFLLHESGCSGEGQGGMGSMGDLDGRLGGSLWSGYGMVRSKSG